MPNCLVFLNNLLKDELQDPLEIQAKCEIILNEGNIYIFNGNPPFVVEAYKRWFQSDFSNFLRSR